MIRTYIVTCLLLGLTPLILRAGTIRDDRNPRDYLRLGACSGLRKRRPD